MVDHYAVGAHGTCKPDRLEIEGAAIERKKDLCIGVCGNSALWYAVSFVSGRNYNHEILISCLPKKKSDLRRGCNSVAIIVGDHDDFVPRSHVFGQQCCAFGHSTHGKMPGEIFEFSANEVEIEVAILQNDVYYIRNRCWRAVT